MSALPCLSAVDNYFRFEKQATIGTWLERQQAERFALPVVFLTLVARRASSMGELAMMRLLKY